MCKIDGKIKDFCDVFNHTGQDISYRARNEYDAFLEKCLKPYGINKLNADLYRNRVRIKEDNPHIEGFETVSYQRFYIDGKYEFTVVFKQKPVSTGRFISGMIITYEKVVEQDLVPNEMPNEEVINTLKCLMNSTPESATSKRDKALNKAIAALEEQDKYQWIFAYIGDPKWDDLFEEVEKALGFKLFYWQKTYIMMSEMRRFGGTTANILRSLLDVEGEPLDYTKPAMNNRDRFYRDTLLDVKEKLDKAGIKTREVWRCKAEKDEWYKKRSASITSRNYSGPFDKED